MITIQSQNLSSSQNGNLASNISWKGKFYSLLALHSLPINHEFEYFHFSHDVNLWPSHCLAQNMQEPKFTACLCQMPLDRTLNDQAPSNYYPNGERGRWAFGLALAGLGNAQKKSLCFPSVGSESKFLVLPLGSNHRILFPYQLQMAKE